MRREAENVEPRAKARRDMAAGFLLLSMKEGEDEGVWGGRGGVGGWLPLAWRLAPRGCPFEWSVCGSQGLRRVGLRARGEGGVAIEGPGSRLRL